MPAGFTQTDAVARFFDAARSIVGEDRVFTAPIDRAGYSDPMAFDPERHQPSGAVAAETVEEIQQILKTAAQEGVPLWPISRGKNFGYGGAAPVQAGAVVLDLSRMKRILEINEDLGYCVVEPGVSFYDLHDALAARGHRLWMSVPGNSWGSVAGNALERGVGPQPYGDHAAQICGLEVVLADGALVRTGAGAMEGNPAWHVTRNSYGPGWDQIFCQSNFGVVTRMGLWLMPAPEATMTLSLQLPEADDIERGIGLFAPLRLRGVIDHDAAWVSYIGIASYVGPRSMFWDGEGLLPESVGARIREQLKIGWWNAEVNLYGPEEVIAAKAKIVSAAAKNAAVSAGDWRTWRQGDDFGLSHAGIPSTRDMTMIGWYGGRGGHLGFSPVMPSDPALAAEQFRRARKRYEEFGIDYYGAFGVGGRQTVAVNEILYDRDSKEQERQVHALFETLIRDTHQAGFGEYRTHIDYMDAVADTFDFNDHAMGRLNEALKDTLDPKGILAPGKQGIWPARFRT
ncbi:FAD-binding oxidoreductase [Altericroceibacterium xinjiangense]|uniref:FAD-binding oxidoreductase n=1 Tax=Altericroceibacterium xinjiangense TaxID=762261 RepID=UPI000F7F4A88|nr:FAD-binding oxidoreductase [Altericroceibacterium xinjiangense]